MAFAGTDTGERKTYVVHPRASVLEPQRVSVPGESSIDFLHINVDISHSVAAVSRSYVCTDSRW